MHYQQLIMHAVVTRGYAGFWVGCGCLTLSLKSDPLAEGGGVEEEGEGGGEGGRVAQQHQLPVKEKQFVNEMSH